MSRRSHRKSKHGCAQCKARHVKCDETRPQCVNCRTGEQNCSFMTSASSSTSTPSQQGTPAATATKKSQAGTDASSHGFQEPPLADLYVANMVQLELLSHFYSVTWKTLGRFSQSQESTIEVVSRYAVSVPYLMHELLAISALHLGILRPAREEYFRDYSAGFQTQAIALFNEAKAHLDASTCVPMFLFSSLLGIHVLCDTLRYYRRDLNVFLEQFVTYLNLHRGVGAITSQSWHLLRQTELKPIIQASETPPESKKVPRGECDELKELIERCDLSASSVSAYQDAIKHLQWVFDVVEPPGTPRESPQMIFAWPVLISTGYVGLLHQQRPEALIILAYYAVLLHRYRGFWCFGDGGGYLIRSITQHLGPYWATSLAWPNEIVDATAQDRPWP